MTDRVTIYPRTNERGDTVWACCESSIAQPCRHKRRRGDYALVND
jgi:hypothetical protein